MPAPPPESLPAIVSAVRMLIRFRAYDALSRRLASAAIVASAPSRLACRPPRPRAPAPCSAPRRSPARAPPRSASRVPGSPIPFTLQPVAVLLAGRRARRPPGRPQPGAVPGGSASPARRCSRWSPVLLPGAARLLGPTGGFLLAFPAGRRRRRAAGATAAWTRSATPARRRRCWPASRRCTPAASRGLSLFMPAAGAGLVAAFAPYAAADLVKVALVAPAVPAVRRALSARRRSRGRAVGRVGAARRSGSTETAGTSRAAAARSPARVASAFDRSPAATRSSRVGSRARRRRRGSRRRRCGPPASAPRRGSGRA